jgi:CubicO group peptidase (beta-lactamase class C family)
MEQAIFKPLNLSSTTFSKPSDSHAVLPLGQYFWDVAQGVHSPTGGIYSSSSDMSAYCRYVLTHHNALDTGVNWFLPASWDTYH